MAKPVYILDHHNRVIHQHPNPQRKSGQRDHIQGNTAEIHQDNRRHHADGDGAGNDKRRLDILHKNKQDQNRQNGSGNHIVHNGVHHKVDIHTLIHQYGKMNILLLFLDLLHAFQKSVCHVTGGISRLFFHGKHDTRIAIQAGVNRAAVISGGNIRHILKPNGLKPLHSQIQYDQLLQASGICNLISHTDQEFVFSLLKITCRHGKVLSRQNTFYQILCDKLGEVGVFFRLLFGIRQLFFSFFQLRLRLRKLCLCLGHLAATCIQLRLGYTQIDRSQKLLGIHFDFSGIQLRLPGSKLVFCIQKLLPSGVQLCLARIQRGKLCI